MTDKEHELLNESPLIGIYDETLSRKTTFSTDKMIIDELHRINVDPDTLVKTARLNVELQQELRKVIKERDAAILESQRWIPVDERMPEYRVDVLLYFDAFKTMTVGFFDPFESIWCVEKDIGWDYASYNPTHWMPLPPMPKGENK